LPDRAGLSYAVRIMDAIRTRAAQEARRRLAVQKVNDGWSQADVADFLGVHPVSVNKWVRAFRAAGDGCPARRTAAASRC
jgi:transposase